jgi:SAM-dependent methyltransferase
MRENEDVVGRFEAHVEQIQHLAQMSFYQDLLSTIVEKAELKSGEKVLDVGSGPGWLTIRAAKRVGEVGKVFGIDISPRMPNGVPKGVQSQENGRQAKQNSRRYHLPKRFGAKRLEQPEMGERDFEDAYFLLLRLKVFVANPILADYGGGVVPPYDFVVVLSPEKPCPGRSDNNVKARAVFLNHFVDISPDLC